MVLNIKYDKMYNSERKKEFIESSYNTDDSKKVVANVFYKSYYTEVALNTDLCDFNEGQLSSAMFSLELTTLSSAKGVGSTIKSYIDWCYLKGLRRSNLNIMNTVDDNWYKNTLDKTKKLLFSKEFIEETVDNLKDYQDKALIMLLFEGVYGKRLSEIRNLKLSDIDEETNIATVYGEDNTKGREVQLTPETVELVKNADIQGHYTNVEGKTFELIANDYIFRNTTKGRSEVNKTMSQVQLINRLSKIAEMIEMSKFNPNNINRSGMLYVYYQELLNKNDGKLDFDFVNNNKDLSKAEVENAIAEKYNWSLLKSSKGYTFYNTSNYRKSFLNIENVLDIYSPSTSSVKG